MRKSSTSSALPSFAPNAVDSSVEVESVVQQSLEESTEVATADDNSGLNARKAAEETTMKQNESSSGIQSNSVVCHSLNDAGNESGDSEDSASSEPLFSSSPPLGHP